MPDNKQIAHELAMVFITNRYGTKATGSFAGGNGTIESSSLPATTEETFIKEATGERGLFGREKKENVKTGYAVDDIFAEMVAEYKRAYDKFLALLAG